MTNYEKQVLNNEITDTMLWSMYNYMLHKGKETIDMQTNINNTNNDVKTNAMTSILGLIMAMNMVSKEKGGELADEFIRQNTRIKTSGTD